jgi:hypothetical protein
VLVLFVIVESSRGLDLEARGWLSVTWRGGVGVWHGMAWHAEGMGKDGRGDDDDDDVAG